MQDNTELAKSGRKTHGLDFPTSDTGNAEFFAYRFGEQVRFVHPRKKWLIWDEHRWAASRKLWRLT